MKRVKTIIALAVMLAAAGVILHYFAVPLTADNKLKKEAGGADLLKLHEEYPDLIGWIRVDGTNIDYPVMEGEEYLYENMEGESDKSGTPFVEEGWRADDRCTIIYGHNMWMLKTMFSALHKFEDEDFFSAVRNITFYAICDEADDAYVEKRTFSVSHCILTDVSEWNYSQAQLYEEDEDIAEFLAECDKRSIYGAETSPLPEKMIMLSTCSYHISGRDGRTVIVGKLSSVENKSTLD